MSGTLVLDKECGVSFVKLFVQDLLQEEGAMEQVVSASTAQSMERFGEVCSNMFGFVISQWKKNGSKGALDMKVELLVQNTITFEGKKKD